MEKTLEQLKSETAELEELERLESETKELEAQEESDKAPALPKALGLRGLLSLGTKEQHQEYLSKKFGPENIKWSPDETLMIKQDGKWFRVDPKGFDIGDVTADVGGHLLPFIGASIAAPIGLAGGMAGGTFLGPAGTLAGGASGAAAGAGVGAGMGEMLRQKIGQKVLGTEAGFSPQGISGTTATYGLAEGLGTVAGAGAQALGQTKPAKAIKEAITSSPLYSMATKAKQGISKNVAGALESTTGKPATAWKHYLKRPMEVAHAPESGPGNKELAKKVATGIKQLEKEIGGAVGAEKNAAQNAGTIRTGFKTSDIYKGITNIDRKTTASVKAGKSLDNILKMQKLDKKLDELSVADLYYIRKEIDDVIPWNAKEWKEADVLLAGKRKEINDFIISITGGERGAYNLANKAYKELMDLERNLKQAGIDKNNTIKIANTLNNILKVEEGTEKQDLLMELNRILPKEYKYWDEVMDIATKKATSAPVADIARVVATLPTAGVGTALTSPGLMSRAVSGVARSTSPGVRQRAISVPLTKTMLDEAVSRGIIQKPGNIK